LLVIVSRSTITNDEHEQEHESAATYNIEPL